MSLDGEPVDSPDLRLRLLARLDQALDTLEQAPGFAKSRYQPDVFRLATDLMDRAGGFEALYTRAGRFEHAGLFYGGPWEDPARLQPALVGPCLKGEGISQSVEVLSELRVLAIATGQLEHPRLSAQQAHVFLKQTIALNLDLLFPEATEESRLRAKAYARAEALFRQIQATISLDGLQGQLLQEIELLLAQRPIQKGRLGKLITYVKRLPAERLTPAAVERILLFSDAIGHPSPLSRDAGALSAYAAQLLQVNESSLEQESDCFRQVLISTGIGNPYHAVLLRHLASSGSRHLARALALDAFGTVQLDKTRQQVGALIDVAIFAETANAIEGLSQVLNRGLLARPEVSQGLFALSDIEIAPEVEALLASVGPARAVLVAGALSVLGLPLGIGQGTNPTCQAARGISLWAQHDPGYLLQLIASAARDQVIVMDFEDQNLRSDALAGGLALGSIDRSLDPISLLLVPHLDRLYDEMMRLAALRGEDQHKWVNPAFYRWVPKGFASVFNVTSKSIEDYAGFVRLFYATHHPAFNREAPLLFPNPVGLFITDVHGNFLGLHAVSIQRVAEDPSGELRVYFFNPNNEGRQQWGEAIETSVAGAGEQPGESSLPFAQFTVRVYAFHYNPFELGDGFEVPAQTVEALTTQARESWGKAYLWSSPEPNAFSPRLDLGPNP
ncbi:MAG: hypothetical protein CVV27_10475 [Candidatus Melainabacteria bacterium HGW-Melainabacteria-1]|nr:MAG: hypothetical protein CVV27_10475 [Candidatus Melainabacteria bacterium HGW-Melainabacteria-1]